MTSDGRTLETGDSSSLDTKTGAIDTEETCCYCHCPEHLGPQIEGQVVRTWSWAPGWIRTHRMVEWNQQHVNDKTHELTIGSHDVSR